MDFWTKHKEKKEPNCFKEGKSISNTVVVSRQVSFLVHKIPSLLLYGCPSQQVSLASEQN